jgi:hypothetical protein
MGSCEEWGAVLGTVMVETTLYLPCWKQIFKIPTGLSRLTRQRYLGLESPRVQACLCLSCGNKILCRGNDTHT